MLQQLGAASLPRVTVLNKLDLVADRAQLAALWQQEPRAVAVSVLSGEGMPELLAAMQDHIASFENKVSILVPHAAGGLHGEIRAKATVISEFYTEQGCLMEIQASPALLGRLLAEGARMAEPGDRPEAD